MRSGLVVFGAIWLLSACAAPEVASDGSVGELTDSLERRRAFEDAIVGHTLRGEGVDVTVAQDGALVGITHKGVESPAYVPGLYSPYTEGLVEKFCSWYVERLSAALQADDASKIAART